MRARAVVKMVANPHAHNSLRQKLAFSESKLRSAASFTIVICELIVLLLPLNTVCLNTVSSFTSLNHFHAVLLLTVSEICDLNNIR